MAILVVGFIGILVFAGNDNDSTGDDPANESGTASTHIYGEGASGVTLVEYGDFQCPACAAYYPFISQIKEEFSDEITVQYKHFPLINIHPNAMIAHRAAEAAGKQDRFWEMHDILFERQQEWGQSNNPQPLIDGYASQIGLDMEQYKQDAASAAVAATINADIRDGQALNITGTPAFVLNGERLDELPRDYEAIRTIIQEAIDQQN